MTERIRWVAPDGLAIEAVVPPLISAFEDGRVIVAMEVDSGGDYRLTFNVVVDGDQVTLPQVEAYIAACARRLLEPLAD